MATYADASVTDVNSKHANGVPKNCTLVTDTTATARASNPRKADCSATWSS
jgi:hypothetical protein